MENGIAAALLSVRPRGYLPNNDAVCVAFDGDAVLFSPDSELIYKTQGLSAFLNHEIQNADTPMRPGPFANVLISLAKIQRVNKSRLRLALVSARNQSAGTRVIRTLNEWGIDLNEIHFLGGNEKANLLAAIRTHIFFDDQEVHINPASKLVPAALVPCFALEGLKEDRPQVSPMHEKKVEHRLALDKPC
jgi:5'-nucleotidase